MATLWAIGYAALSLVQFLKSHWCVVLVMPPLPICDVSVCTSSSVCMRSALPGRTSDQ